MKQSRDCAGVINLRLISYRLMTLLNGRLWAADVFDAWMNRAQCRTAAAAAQVCSALDECIQTAPAFY